MEADFEQKLEDEFDRMIRDRERRNSEQRGVVMAKTELRTFHTTKNATEEHSHGGVSVACRREPGLPCASPTNGETQVPRPPARLARKGRSGHGAISWSTPPLYIQEKIHPKALIDDLLRSRRTERESAPSSTSSATSTAFPRGRRRNSTGTIRTGRTEMILGDSLHVMASLAEREGCGARCSTSSTRRTASSSTATNGPRQAAT